MGVAAAAQSDEGAEPTYDAESAVLRAVAEPRRRAILRLVASAELSAGEIAQAFDVSRPAISQHLTVLKDAGLLAERRAGARRLYRTRAEGFAALRRFLDEMWGDALAAAAALAEAEPEPPTGRGSDTSRQPGIREEDE